VREVKERTKEELAAMRLNYTIGHLIESECDKDPMKQFAIWFQHAKSCGLREPNAMVLAAVSSDGKPSSRVVLLKSIDDRGFVFFTNYQSRKSCEIKSNPNVSAVFFWAELERSVRIEGIIELVSCEESDEYFHSRPRASQIGAWASQQSSPIASREVLEKQFVEAEERFLNLKVIPRPSFWGGWRIIPFTIEFWQGRPSRLHDRLQFKRTKESNGWRMQRLSP